MRNPVPIVIVHARLLMVGAGLGDVYTPSMKTAISIPDDVFHQAERLAAETRQSRSCLYSRAVREYVARHSSDAVTAALDALYEREDADTDLGFARRAARKTLERTEW
jgi:predicted transcriptional regulator